MATLINSYNIQNLILKRKKSINNEKKLENKRMIGNCNMFLEKLKNELTMPCAQELNTEMRIADPLIIMVSFKI